MKLRQVLIFFVSVLSVLLLISFIFPKNGIEIYDGFRIHFLTYDELLDKKPEDINIYDVLLKNINLDSLLNAKKTTESDTILLDPDELKKTIQPLEFGKDGSSILESFFRSLNTINDEGSLIRVMHYGDSQIECDRISSFLRFKLQGQFGGCGIGLQPVIQAYDYQFPLEIVASSNWERYSSYGPSKKEIENKKFGPLASFCRFSPLLPDSVKNDSITHNATINIIPGKYGYANSRKFKQLRLFYGHNKSPVYLEIINNDIVYRDTLFVQEHTKVKKWVFDAYTDHITINLSGYDSPNVYALALDDTKGVAVDNIALRGNSGTVFTSLNYENLSRIFGYLNTKLIILQFGGNALPWIDSEDACKSYAQSLLSQIRRFKSIRPDASIIIVGPADKSVKEKDKYVSYKYIEPLIEEMKDASFKGGAAYWDVYKAMGGKNSMPVWVNEDLAASDYIHFSTQGASVIANMLYNAIIFEYNNYKRNKPQEEEFKVEIE